MLLFDRGLEVHKNDQCILFKTSGIKVLEGYIDVAKIIEIKGIGTYEEGAEKAGGEFCETFGNCT